MMAMDLVKKALIRCRVTGGTGPYEIAGSVSAPCAASGRFGAARRKQIAGAAHRANDRRMGRIRLDLAAQARDPHIDRAVEGLAVARVGEVEQLLAGQDALGI